MAKEKIDLGLERVKMYLHDLLVSCVDKELITTTNTDKVEADVEANLILLFNRYIVGSYGEEQPKFIKVDEALLLYYYNGKCFIELGQDVLRVAIRDTMLNLGINPVYALNCHKKIFENVFLGLCANNHTRIVNDTRYVVFNNVVLDLDTDETFEHSMDFNTTTILDFDYDPTVKCEKWITFLEQVLPELDFRYALQEFCGVMFVDRYKYKVEKACYLLGGGQNGKSVFTDVIKNILGKQNYCVFSPDLLFKGSTPSYSMATISGKVANICDDASNSNFSGGEYKSFVSGAEVQARNPYGKPFIVSKIPIMILNVNQMPVTTDDSNGYHRRTLIISFNMTISEKDKDTELTTKLTTEDAKMGVMNWILEGRKRFIKNKGKFTQYEAVKAIQEDAKGESNNVYRWLRSLGYAAGNEHSHTITKFANDLYNDYVKYCMENGEKPRPSAGFGRLLSSEQYGKKRTSLGTQYFMNIKTNFDVEVQKELDAGENAPF